MKLPTYKDVLKMGEDTLKKTLAPVKAARAKKQAELEMCKLDEQIATKEAEIHEQCCKEDVNFSRLIDMQDSLALAERKKKQYQKILDEMFPED
jgi:hypothetical protein